MHGSTQLLSSIPLRSVGGISCARMDEYGLVTLCYHILLLFYKNSHTLNERKAEERSSLKVDFHCCVNFTYVRVEINLKGKIREYFPRGIPTRTY